MLNSWPSVLRRLSADNKYSPRGWCFQTGPFNLVSPPLTTYNQQLWLTCVMQAEHSNGKTPAGWWDVCSRWITAHLCCSGRLPAAVWDQRGVEGSDAGRQRHAHQPCQPEIANAPLQGGEWADLLITQVCYTTSAAGWISLVSQIRASICWIRQRRTPSRQLRLVWNNLCPSVCRPPSFSPCRSLCQWDLGKGLRSKSKSSLKTHSMCTLLREEAE